MASAAGTWPGRGLYFASMAQDQSTSSARDRAVDKLVLAAVNAPYRRDIDATTLAGCLANAAPGEWTVHVATFFTDVSRDLVFAFSAVHGISKFDLAKTYFAIKTISGEQNPSVEAELASVATAAS